MPATARTYTVKEAAKKIGYSTNSVYGFLKNGAIKAVRIGRGKFKIPEKEIEKLTLKGIDKDTVREPVKENKVLEKTTSVKSKYPIFKPTLGLEYRRKNKSFSPLPQTVYESAVLPKPRPGKSLADLSGESVLHTLRLWFEDRVGLPKLFDWLTSITSILLGISLFLYSSQLDILTVGRLSLWMNPIRIGMILCGIGLILAAMVQEEVGKQMNIANYFRFTLVIIFLGLAGVLYAGGDIDGALIHGLFGVAIFVEALTGVRSSTVYTIYILGLLISTFVVYQYFPKGSGLSAIAIGMVSMLGGWAWILGGAMLVMILTGLYGYFWNKKFLKNILAIYGVMLCALAIYYGATNYWTRAFAVLIAGMIGMLLPYWENFKQRMADERPVVFKMFGIILMCFSIPMILIALVQGTLISNAYRNLIDKAEYAKVEFSDEVGGIKQGATDLTMNNSFVTAVGRNQVSEVANMLKFLFVGRTDVSAAGVIDLNGDPVAIYPSSGVFSNSNFSAKQFFLTVVQTGKPYSSTSMEELTTGIDNQYLIAVPVTNTKNVLSGVLVVSLSGINLSSELQAIGQTSLQQQIFAINNDGRYIIHPDSRKLGTMLTESDALGDIWRQNKLTSEGYDWKGTHALFGSSKDERLGLTIVAEQSIQKVLDVSSGWLAGLLFMQLIAGLIIFVFFIFFGNTKMKEEV